MPKWLASKAITLRMNRLQICSHAPNGEQPSFSSKRCRAEYRLPPHSKMAGAASLRIASRRQIFSRSEPPQSGVARNTACHRTPKWLARRPEALRPGGSSFPAPNLLKAVSRGIPLATALQNGWRGVPKPSVSAAASWSAVASGIPRDTAFPGFAKNADPSQRRREPEVAKVPEYVMRLPRHEPGAVYESDRRGLGDYDYD